MRAPLPARAELLSEPNKAFLRKAGRQVAKDFVIHPALTGPGWKRMLQPTIVTRPVRFVICGRR